MRKTMNIKSKYISFLIFIVILLSITAVSASENQNITVGTADNYISENANLLQKNQIGGFFKESQLNNDSNQIQENDTESEDVSIDENSFTALYDKIKQADEVNLEHDYRFNESCDDDLENILEYYELEIDHDKLVINGFNHVIDGAGIGAQFSFENKQGEIIINDVV